MSCGGYPMGAEYDPRAPWNEREPTMVKCAACDGNGKHWFAYNIATGNEVECGEDAWNTLYDDEELADANGVKLIRGSVETCEVCNGEGDVEYDEDFEPDYDDD